MTYGAILTLAVGLAMDATAVSATRGMSVSRVRPRHVLTVALFFGGFQALMPLCGWMIGASVGTLVETWDHWIACGLLTGVGGKMLWEALSAKDDEAPRCCDEDVFGFRVMLALAVATSIDAFAVGITLPMLDAPLVISLATIGLVTALLSTIGLFAGRRFGTALGPKLDALGGIALIFLGVKIVLDHTCGH